jgi:hypothetical protein
LILQNIYPLCVFNDTENFSNCKFYFKQIIDEIKKLEKNDFQSLGLVIDNLYLCGDLKFLNLAHNVPLNCNEFCILCDFNKSTNSDYLNIYNKRNYQQTNLLFPNLIVVLDVLHLKINFIKQLLNSFKNIICLKNNSTEIVNNKIKELEVCLNIFHINLNLMETNLSVIGQTFDNFNDKLVDLICDLLGIHEFSENIKVCKNFIQNLNNKSNNPFPKNCFEKLKTDLQMEFSDYYHMIPHFHEMSSKINLCEFSQYDIESSNKKIKKILLKNSNFKRNIKVDYMLKLLINLFNQ